jgi:hypothetical protein
MVHCRLHGLPAAKLDVRVCGHSLDWACMHWLVDCDLYLLLINRALLAQCTGHIPPAVLYVQIVPLLDLRLACGTSNLEREDAGHMDCLE